MSLWIRYEGDANTGLAFEWRGPYEDSLQAERLAQAETSGRLGGRWRFGELISGPAGDTGRRMAEVYLGQTYEPGRSCWHELPLALDIPVPADAGRGR